MKMTPLKSTVMSEVGIGSMKSIKVEKKYLAWWVYVFFSTLCPNVLLGQLALIIFIVSSLSNRISKKVYYWKSYIILEIIFLVYSIIQCFGIAVSSYDAQQMCKTVFICLVFDIAFFAFSSTMNIKKVINAYVSGTFWGFIACLLLYGNTIGNAAAYEGRLTSAINLQLGPIRIFGHSPTALAAIASNALIIAALAYWKEDRRKAWRYIAFFSLIILLTQSRKNVMFILVATFVIPYVYSGKGINKRKIKIILSSVSIGAIAFIALLKVPYLYQHFGQRLMSVFSSVLGIGVNESVFGESSIRTRAELVTKAIKAVHEKPILGWGLNNFSAVINNGGYYAHNNYLEILVSGGMVGFVIYYCKYLFIGWRMFRGSRFTENSTKAIYKIGLIVFLLYCVLEYWQITYMFRFIYILPLLLLQYARMEGE